MRVANCRSCKAPIIWCLTSSGKKMPVDADPSEAGTFYLEGDDVQPVARHVRGFEGPIHERGELHTSHFATCPQAEQFKGRRGNAIVPLVIFVVVSLFWLTTGMTLGSKIARGAPEQPQAEEGALRMELAVCVSVLDRSKEVLDSVDHWMSAYYGQRSGIAPARVSALAR